MRKREYKKRMILIGLQFFLSVILLGGGGVLAAICLQTQPRLEESESRIRNLQEQLNLVTEKEKNLESKKVELSENPSKLKEDQGQSEDTDNEENLSQDAEDTAAASQNTDIQEEILQNAENSGVMPQVSDDSGEVSGMYDSSVEGEGE